jgi:hypothetical protein
VKTPEFKLLPCVFCTIGFNRFVAGYKIVSTTYHALNSYNAPLETPEFSDANKCT